MMMMRRVMCVLAVLLCCACGYTMAAAATTAGQPKAVMAEIGTPEVAVVSRFVLGLPSDASVEDVKNAEKELQKKSKVAECEKDPHGVDCKKPPAVQAEATASSSGLPSASSQVPSVPGQLHEVNSQKVIAEPSPDARPGVPVQGALSADAARGAAAAHGQEEAETTVGAPSAVHDAAAREDQPTKPNDTSKNGGDITEQREKSPEQVQEAESTHVVQNEETTAADTKDTSGQLRTEAAPAPPSAPETSSNNPLTETSNESNAAESVVTNVTNDEENTTSNEESTTTTTTTLPPVPTTDPRISSIASAVQKNANADNSVSPLWVRVPLLIVVTLACILVC
ncbi:uncharacterized protein TM35_000113010 [Trypanosoma theileri]|uniref:Mucin-associated surface protein (MASP) n=1 Tax=Trypanosoma theileri TaxID=67003 RepID=A0A1X0NYL3_9TRYP|nr:uncharacterized protein TM35_000113010 [Trypanosoma theileri]ORC89767.1 hypothetical protein TM35_000113010 [Trypanosoma theileri]